MCLLTPIVDLVLTVHGIARLSVSNVCCCVQHHDSLFKYGNPFVNQENGSGMLHIFVSYKIL